MYGYFCKWTNVVFSLVIHWLTYSHHFLTTGGKRKFVLVKNVPFGYTYIFSYFRIKPELDTRIDPDMVLTPLPSSILDEK
jgi:hypothetical protein